MVRASLGVLEVGGVGEPAVDLRQHRARFVAVAVRCEQSREVRCRAPFPGFRAHLLRDREVYSRSMKPR